MDAHGAAEQAARSSFARLVAFLATRTHDLLAAEDALADAFVRAVETWPRTGVPERPEAWLLTTARRRWIDASRHLRIAKEHAEAVGAALGDDSTAAAGNPAEFPDERLRLMFVCAHPAIDRAVRAPLMLQVVLGLSAARISSAFLLQPAALGQRLSRAKAKIRDAGIPFDVPPPVALPARLDAVLDAVYAAYGSGWEDVAGADDRQRDLSAEAIELGRLIVRLMPGEPESLGLLALTLHCQARRAARRDAQGGYVQLSNQDVSLWSRPLMEEAEQHLRAASERNRPGRYQLEAAIQSVHAQRAWTGRTDWSALEVLYEGLVRLAPSVGALVGRAAAVAVARDAASAWRLLQAIPPNAVESYQPYWALAAHLLVRLARPNEAKVAYTRAMGLCVDPAVRQHLARTVATLCCASDES